MTKPHHLTAIMAMAVTATACGSVSTYSPGFPSEGGAEPLRITGQVATARLHAGDASYSISLSINGERVVGGKLAEQGSALTFHGSYRQQPVTARCHALPQDRGEAVIRCNLRIGTRQEQTLTLMDFGEVGV